MPIAAIDLIAPQWVTRKPGSLEPETLSLGSETMRLDPIAGTSKLLSRRLAETEMTATATTRDLQRQVQAAKLVREQILDLVGEDAELIRDSIEGQTSLLDMLSAMTQADGEDAALAEGIAAYIKKLQDRKKRIEDRIEMRRALMANALEVAELSRLQTASGTVTRKALPPKAVVLEEADIPSRFYVPQAPKLDRGALLAALKARAAAIAEVEAEPGSPAYESQLATIDVEHPPIPGASLSNGGATIQIRR